MPVIANKRIDAGIKRGPKQEIRKMRQEARRAPRSDLGASHLKYTPEQRQTIIEAVPEAILNGETTTQVAHRFGIPSVTLRAWIIGSPQVEEARGVMLAHELATRSDDIDCAADPLALARAREGFRAWSWIAERRESRLYGQQIQALAVQVNPSMNITIVSAQPVDKPALEHQVEPEALQHSVTPKP